MSMSKADPDVVLMLSGQDNARNREKEMGCGEAETFLVRSQKMNLYLSELN